MDIKRTLEFKTWIDGLRDLAGRARVQARIERLAAGNPGDHRNLAGGVCEMRIQGHGPGYRVYYTQRGNELIVLLCGGDKHGKASQQDDIRKAIELAENL